MFRQIAILVATAGFLLAAGNAHAQRLVAPDEIVIYVHKDMKETDFVDGLVCELGRVLVAPVRATNIDLPLLRSYLATPNQFDVDKLGPAFAHAVDNEGHVFRYLLIPYDLKVQGLNYLFSNTFTDGSNAAVMSTIRLIPREAGLSRKRISDITGDRIYKLMMKSVALLSGLRANGCVMAFPRNLPELDQKAAEFCEPDKAALIAAGVLKEKPFGACNTVAMLAR
jgi:predicted Zn-dependent protease